MAHKATVVRDQDERYYGSCTCKQNSGPTRFLNYWQADDWVISHMASVERALAHLHARGSLRTERDHAKAMMTDPNTSAKDKATWQILHDGAAARLRDLGDPDPSVEGLW